MSYSMASRARYVIYGAGSIGCAVGGLLVRAGCRVLFVARPRLAQAIAAGLAIRTADGDTKVRGNAVTALDRDMTEANDVVIITVKSQDTAAVAAHLSSIYEPDAAIVCLQNGVSNEPIVSEHFSRVYAGLLLISTVQLQPELVTLNGNRIAIGRYPEGADQIAEELVSDLKRAGLDAMVAPHVMALKWAKLIANLNNASHAITGYWLEKSAADPEMRALMLAVREEGLRVLDAAGIRVEPDPGEKDPLRIKEETAKLGQPPARDLREAAALPELQRTYPSMLQDLLLGRKANEGDFLNGEIVKLGERLGIPTPYNRMLLQTIERMSREGVKPGLYSPASLKAAIEGGAG